jgi:hypothetical protein
MRKKLNCWEYHADLAADRLDVFHIRGQLGNVFFPESRILLRF